MTRSASAGSGGGHSLQDLVGALRQEFGTRYDESYERGKHDFRDALVKRLDLERENASSIVDDLEEAQIIRFKSAGDRSSRDADGPRVGLFDAPGPQVGDDQEPEYGGRYWALGADEDLDLPGAT